MKVLMTIDSDHQINDICKDFESLRTEYHEKIKFIQKQAEDAKAKYKKDADPFWEKLRARLKELNKLPMDYSPEEYILEFEYEENSINLTSVKERNVGSFFTKLLGDVT